MLVFKSPKRPKRANYAFLWWFAVGNEQNNTKYPKTRQALRPDGSNISIKRRSYDKFVRIIFIIIKLIACEVSSFQYEISDNEWNLAQFQNRLLQLSLFDIHLGFHFYDKQSVSVI